jgi:hypothetical protein
MCGEMARPTYQLTGSELELDPRSDFEERPQWPVVWGMPAPPAGAGAPAWLLSGLCAES